MDSQKGQPNTDSLMTYHLCSAVNVSFVCMSQAIKHDSTYGCQPGSTLFDKTSPFHRFATMLASTTFCSFESL